MGRARGEHEKEIRMEINKVLKRRYIWNRPEEREQPKKENPFPVVKNNGIGAFAATKYNHVQTIKPL